MNIIYARGIAGEIGFQNKLPWPYLEKDMQRFKYKTKGQIVLMGRNTFKSLKKPLPGRENWVLTKRNDLSGIRTFKSIQDALKEKVNYPEKELWVIGGADVLIDVFTTSLKKQIKVVEETLIFKIFRSDLFIPTQIHDWYRDLVLEKTEPVFDEKEKISYCFNTWRFQK